MGRRSCNEPVPPAYKQADASIVRIFFRETGMPVHTGTSDEYNLMRISVTE
ncbi:MAG: hypothetical protein WC586_12270 [Methanoregula sp.]